MDAHLDALAADPARPIARADGGARGLPRPLAPMLPQRMDAAPRPPARALETIARRFYRVRTLERLRRGERAGTTS
jgi:hypothetical protein